MKIKDLVRQLQAVLPKYSPLFSDDLVIASISKVAGVVTLQTTTPHNLQTGNKALIKNVLVKNPVDMTTTPPYVDSDNHLVLTFVTAHDKTLGYPTTLTARVKFYNIAGVQLSDVTYTILDVPDKNTLVLDVGTVPAGVTANLLEDRMDGYNGFHTITVPVGSLDTFTYIQAGLTLSTDLSASKVTSNYRIAAEADPERVFQSYEKPVASSDLWAWVVPGKTQGSFTRESQTDAQARFTKAEDYYQELYKNFHVLVVVPTSQDVGAVEAFDLMEDIRTALFKSIVGVMFQGGFEKKEKYMCTYSEDSFYMYIGSVYIHNFVFQVMDEIGSDDICVEDDTRAFRKAEIDNAMQFDGYDDPARKNAKADL
jgi:uncharacterized membrane protein